MKLGLAQTSGSYPIGMQEDGGRCKVDYEAIIARAKRQSELATNLKAATKAYMRESGFPGSDEGIFAMIGFLDTKIDTLEVEIANAIKMQERESA